MSGAWFEVIQPGQAPRVVTVDRRVVVGRDAEDVRLDDVTVSRRHLYVEPVEDVLLCVDMGSANGTWIDGERISEPRVVRPGDRIRVGECELVVHAPHRTTRADAPAATEPAGRASEGRRGLNRPTASRDPHPR